MKGGLRPPSKQKTSPASGRGRYFCHMAVYYQDGMTVPLYFSRMKAFTSGLW